MNSNWSRLKRKLNEDKQHNQSPPKRRKLTPPRSNPSTKNKKKSKHKHRTNNDDDQSFLTKYSNAPSSKPSNSKTFARQIERYRKQTPKKQLYDAFDLSPPSSTDRDIEQRKAFWNDVRLKLRARLPKSFLFKMITPLSEATDTQRSSKLHVIKPSTKASHVMAMDCEMVGIGKKSILARVSIVNYNGDVMYDKFVKPKNDPKCRKITDYREDITGITRNDLVNYGIGFEQAQQEIIEVLKGRKVIGHAINNDFAVIQCSHVLKRNYYSTVIANDEATLSKRQSKKLQQKKRNDSWFFDTAKCELLHDSIHQPRSLKFLLELYLGIHIQSEAHDSVIDAISTMAIYRAVLPEIKARKRERKLEKQNEEQKKKKWKEKETVEREKRKKIQRNRNILNNYAYDNSLDKLIAQFGTDEKMDNFDKQLLSSNPYDESMNQKKESDK